MGSKAESIRMRTTKLIVTCVLLAFVSHAYAQLPVNDLYQYNYVSINPSFAGVYGQNVSLLGTLTIPERGGDRVTSGFAGFESYVSKISSGFGGSAAAVTRGFFTHSYLNAFGNYQLKVNDDSKVIFGLKITGYQGVLDFTEFIETDPSDPVIDVFPTTSTSDIRGGASILYKRNKFFAGLTADNIVRSRQTDDARAYDALAYRQFSFQSGADFDLGPRVTSVNSLYLFSEEDYKRFDINTSLLIKEKFIVGCSLEVNSDDWVLPKLNGGVNFKDIGRVLVVLYSKEADLERRFNGQLMLQVKI